MSQHGRSGMKFAGRVSQVITASTGLDDWEWGVTLWARNPSYLKDIVYTMRFDESSARYAFSASSTLATSCLLTNCWKRSGCEQS